MMSDALVSDLLSETARLAKQTHVEESGMALLHNYYRHVAPADLEHRTPADLLGPVVTHLQVGKHRPDGTSVVRVFTPTVSDNGWSVGHTVVQIVTDDMPFLVDSVSLALNGLDRTIYLVIHPIVTVRRGVAGDLLEVYPDNGGPPKGCEADPFIRRESWICVEIDHSTAHVEQIHQAVSTSVRDVRDAVEDWPRLSARAEEVAEQLRTDPPPHVDSIELHETAALLDWLVKDNFTFLGFREYDLVGDSGEEALRAVPGSGLGILRADQTQSGAFATLPAAVRSRARDPQPLILTKANSRSTVHRSGYLDYIGVKRFDAHGIVTGERRFVGIYAASAYAQSVMTIPVIRTRVDRVFQLCEVSRTSHTGKAIEHFLETFPREELFQYGAEELADVALAVHQMAERRQTRLFCRRDPYGRFVSCLVYIPRDRYTTAVRLRIQGILREAFGGNDVDHAAFVSESVLARLHIVIRVKPGEQLLSPDLHDVQDRLMHSVRSWDDDFADALRDRVGEHAAVGILSVYAAAFPEGYKEDFSPPMAVGDVLALELTDERSGIYLHLYLPIGADAQIRRLKIYRDGGAISLSVILPVLNSLGVEVMDERPYELLRPDDTSVWIYDFGLRLHADELLAAQTLPDRFEEAFAAAWAGDAEVDALNALIVRGGLNWRQVSVLRAYTRYLRQAGTSFARDDIERALLANARVAVDLVHLFEDLFAVTPDNTPAQLPESRWQHFADEIEAVVSLDDDRILRALLSMVAATQRTNYYRRDEAGSFRSEISIKLDPAAIDVLPEPRPRHEIWVYSPRVEGVHLRFGDIARGGLRWSDRRADFRTEVLGLVKAQEVKNAVIVPVGAKGGFVAKQLPDPHDDRDAWLAEGQAAYQAFIGALMDLTDNYVGGKVVATPEVTRRDGDDAYLVVAADKGTASFSDLANKISVDRNFWLGDAFASGGSTGYDHKAMGITARGAWVSVQRHFRELGINIQSEEFTVAGIGDMSGDVFGNGMLLSPHIRLLAAFDHRHIFLDPNPAAAASFAERKRLFQLPRSSWADYDPALISTGGGVFDRSAKSIAITPQIAQALGLDSAITALVPAELIQAIVTAPVDLLWNGGIGSYVKSKTETSIDVGDKANDAVRVNGEQLRCKVVGEGGNLGFTQLGRIEAASAGVRINNDAVDNSAGVDTSDHEVNLKILLDSPVRSGDLTMKQRNDLLHSLTDEVAEQVLADNYAQNVLLGNARRGAAALISVHGRMIRDLEERGVMTRAIEYLPSDEMMATRLAAGQGLTSPELAVLMAYAKISLSAQLPASLATEGWFAQWLPGYFPKALRDPFAQAIVQHPLAEQIVITSVVNHLINTGGISIVFRACEETGASPAEVVRASAAVLAIFGLDRYFAAINELDNQIPTGVQSLLHLEGRRLLDRGIRWFLQTRGDTLDVATEVSTFGTWVERLMPLVPNALRGIERQRLDRNTQRLVDLGAPPDLAQQASAMLDYFALLDVVEIAGRAEQDPTEVVDVYFAVSQRYDVDRFLGQITVLRRADRWTALARQALRSDLYGALAGFTLGVIRATEPGVPATDRIEIWETDNAEGLARARTTLDEIAAQENADLAMLSVGLRVLRTLVAQARLRP